MTLKELQIGKSAVVDTVGGTGALRQHFLDMGLVPGAQVTLIKLAPMGDPMELRIHGYELTLRLDDAAQIGIIPTEKVPAAPALVDDKMVDHPGLGEGGKYHIKKGEHPLPDGTTLTFALAGNQNCGKTTLFNQLTGSNQHVGNFPGVTVDRKSGAIKGHPETEVTDLPGIYSMSPYSSEEIVTRQFIIGEKPTGIINIVDATNIERNLYLTMQLMELDTPMVLALNMMDEMEKAHPDVFNILLQVLDDGRLTDGQGRVVSFKNTIIIMTSNVGSQAIAAGEQDGASRAEVDKQVNDALRATFKPEFLNRIDDIVVFHPLGLDDIEKIVDIQLKGVRERLDNERISLELTPAAIQALALDGLDPVYGARPLKRLIQRQVVDNVANLIIAGELHEGDTVRVDVRDDNDFYAERVAAKPAGAAVRPDEVE